MEQANGVSGDSLLQATGGVATTKPNDVIVIDDVVEPVNVDVSTKSIPNETIQSQNTVQEEPAIGDLKKQSETPEGEINKSDVNVDPPKVEEISEKDLYTSPELEKYWKAVKDNPADFTGWTYLLQYVEQEVMPGFDLECDLVEL